jgi:arginase
MVLAGLGSLPLLRLLGCRAHPARESANGIDLIEAPNNLGLRPPRPGVEPGTWRGPAALERAGLARELRPARHRRLARPLYSPGPARGTRVRNGNALRTFSLDLAAEVERSLAGGGFPVVVGGDCSNLLGCLLGLRRAGGRGLVHVDGHSDFFHPGNYDAASVLGAAAGMDLALATGRGEELLTRWPGVAGPLVDDADTVQIGERNGVDAYPGLAGTAIEIITVQALRASGVEQTAGRALARVRDRGIDRAWLHVDLDVLDQTVLRAVDSPGTPGLTWVELADLIRALVGSRRIAGLDLAIYDPDLDPDGTQAQAIVACIGSALTRDRAAAASLPPPTCCPVIELRQYTLRPGQRELLIDLFEREFVETQEVEGMTLPGQFRDLDRPDRFVWLRGFADMESRARALAAFYGGPVWKAHGREASATMLDSDNVLLLRPADRRAAFSLDRLDRPAPGSAERSSGLVTATIYSLDRPPSADFIDFFDREMAPLLTAAGASLVARFVSETSPNSFPALPIREGENVLVSFAAFADEVAHERFVAALAGSAPWRDRVAGSLRARLAAPPETLRLAPTSRSLLGRRRAP